LNVLTIASVVIAIPIDSNYSRALKVKNIQYLYRNNKFVNAYSISSLRNLLETHLKQTIFYRMMIKYQTHGNDNKNRDTEYVRQESNKGTRIMVRSQRMEIMWK